ncbi:phenylacetate-CoA oxygenase subunit PaaJ [Betaproteobacteria bacterium PRO7]|jgi:ring-1,2-phenylacetyl-CoA epoxidase subunit PaaD|nr:phenylacetate-CoA oxygenase subunit PaaJ [Burkholderiaceae bacterium]MDL1862243.1 phenylacetate-CoA oxygenase subunit PaaJ [Betaproteobacteria bacterium PRO7]
MTAEQAWEVLARVADPEIPVISVTELGIVRDVRADDDTVEVVVTPTYSGCPATEVIEQSIAAALREAGARDVRIETRLAPAWTTDWIAPAAQEKLRRYGIAPPGASARADEQPLAFVPRVDCPLCGSRNTERLSQFGATACKALYRCRDCREPFEYFKPL